MNVSLESSMKKEMASQQVLVLKQKTESVWFEVLACVFINRAVSDFNLNSTFVAKEKLSSTGSSIRAPAIRVLNRREVDSLEEKIRPAKVTVPDTCMQIHSEDFKNSGAVLMEFLKGLELCSPK